MTLLMLYGATAMGCVIIALFFMRYFQLTRDELFVWFALAFCMFGANRIVLATEWSRDSEAAALVYGIRLIGFLLIVIGIVRKNARAKR